MGFFEDMVAAGALRPHDVTEAEDEQRRSVLIRARRNIAQPPALGGNLYGSAGRYRQMSDELLTKADALDEQKPDFTLFQKYAEQQRRSGDSSMLNALAAQFAGEDFQPVQAQFLKRAMAAKEPVKIGNYGYVGEDGQVVIDPMYQREKTIDNLRRRAISLEQLATSAETAAERNAARAQQDSIMNEIRLMNAQTQRMLAEGRYGDKTPTNQYSVEGSTASPKIITPEVQPSEALGFKGVWQSGVNKVADAFGAGNPQDPNKVATDRLEALGNQTQLYLQDAVPGRPSNYLLQMLEKQAVRPNQMFMGPAGAQTRAQATIAVIDTGLSDLARILNNPTGYSNNDIAQARDGYSRLSQLKAEYGALLGGFGESAGAGDDVDALVRQYTQPTE
jgi:hypothetical protein